MNQFWFTKEAKITDCLPSALSMCRLKESQNATVHPPVAHLISKLYPETVLSGIKRLPYYKLHMKTLELRSSVFILTAIRRSLTLFLAL